MAIVANGENKRKQQANLFTVVMIIVIAIFISSLIMMQNDCIMYMQQLI